MPNIPIHNPHLIYRPDIDGLRAIAITLVIFFHAFPKLLRGGFIGVDIFFVISGYLITGIILKGLSRDNFSLVDFYSRRIKRIFPSLIFVLSSCLIAGWYILLAGEYEILGKHIAAGSIYISNFILQSEAGYFDTDAELKPLLHLWSLAVEEQFYLFFPLLLMLSYRFHINALSVIIIGISISFTLNISQIEDKPVEVFFFPQSRIWELLIGSAIAYISLYTHILKWKTQKISNGLAIVGMGLIVFAWVYLDSKKIFFPFYWALLPTLGTAFLILAGEKAWINNYVLANKIAVFIGLISYPLYLWHWVLLSFANITEVESLSVILKLLILIISVILAWITYFFIERNIRFKNHKFVPLILLITLLSVGLTGYFINLNQGYKINYNLNQKWNEGELGITGFEKNEGNYRENCIKIMNEIGDEKLFEKQYCLLEYADRKPTVILLGDSHANHLFLGLVKNNVFDSENILNRGSNHCFPFFDNPIAANKICQNLINKLLENLRDNKDIKTVILSVRAITEINEKKFVSQKINKENEPYINFQNGMKKTLKYLISINKNVYFILDTPDLEFDPKKCLNRPWRIDKNAVKNICAVPRFQVDARRKRYLEIVMPILSEYPSVRVIDTLPAFCDDNYCWAVKDKKLFYRDHHHLNKTGSVYLGEYLRNNLRKDK